MQEEDDLSLIDPQTLDPNSQEYIEVILARREQNRLNLQDKDDSLEDDGDDSEEPEEIESEKEGAEEPLYAGKYKTIEELEKAYKQLQADYTKRNQQPQEVTIPTEANKTQSTTTEEGNTATIDFDALYQEYNIKGDLSEQTYESLASKGFSKQAVDTYINGVKANIDNVNRTIFESFGGSQENFQEAANWASENLSEREIKSLNKMLTSQDLSEVRIASEALQAKYSKANLNNNNNKPNKLVQSTRTASGSSNETFKSRWEAQQAMRDPRYGKDSRYTDAVALKLARSKFND